MNTKNEKSAKSSELKDTSKVVNKKISTFKKKKKIKKKYYFWNCIRIFYF